MTLSSIRIAATSQDVGRDHRESRVTAARKCSEAAMASLVVLLLAAIAFGALFGGFLMISFAIRREDREKGSLRFDARSYSTKAARTLVGIKSSRWD